jgi:hypothetical protein
MIEECAATCISHHAKSKPSGQVFLFSFTHPTSWYNYVYRVLCSKRHAIYFIYICHHITKSERYQLLSYGKAREVGCLTHRHASTDDPIKLLHISSTFFGVAHNVYHKRHIYSDMYTSICPTIHHGYACVYSYQYVAAKKAMIPLAPRPVENWWYLLQL